MNTTPEERATLRKRAEWIRDHNPYDPEPRIVLPVDGLFALLDDLDCAEAALARVTDDSMVEVGAKAAYEQAFLKHAPADVDRWDDLVTDNDPAAESWREVARAVIRAVAAGEQTSYAEAIAPITKQSQQWADATKADEQEAGQ